MTRFLETCIWIPGLFFLFPFYVWFLFNDACMSKNYWEEIEKTKIKIEKVLTVHAIYTAFQLVFFVYFLSTVVR